MTVLSTDIIEENSDKIKSNEYKAFLRIIHLLVYISAVCLHIYSKYFILWYMVHGTLHKKMKYLISTDLIGIDLHCNSVG